MRGSGQLPMPVAGGCATLCTMDRADRERAEPGAPGNVFYFVADLAAATSWYAARLGVDQAVMCLAGARGGQTALGVQGRAGLTPG